MGRVQRSGFLAWVMWWAIHIMYLIGFRNRFAVMFQWAWSYLTFQRGARLITGEVGRLPALTGIGDDGVAALPPAAEPVALPDEVRPAVADCDGTGAPLG